MGFISNPFFHLFLLSFLLFSTLSFSVAYPNIIHPFQDEQFSVLDDGLGTRKNSIKVTEETSTKDSTYLILAAERTHRRDPLDDYHYYSGGWNINDPHYVFSTGFASMGPFIVAVLWFIMFGLWLFCMCICCCCCCCPRKPYGYSQNAYTLSLVLLCLFTLAVQMGSVFIFVGEERFESSAVDVMSYVLHRADTTLVNLMNLFDHMMAVKDVGIGDLTLPDQQKHDVDEIGVVVDALYRSFRSVTHQDKTEIVDFLDPLKQLLIFVAVVMVVVAVLGFLFSITGANCLMYTLVIMGWIIVSVTFIMSGIFLLVNNLIGDTCVAMTEWQQNPMADSALENIIPKVDNETTHLILSATKNVTYGVVEVANAYISNVSNADNMTPDGWPLYSNQSGPFMPLLCNPYNTNDMQHCGAGEVHFKNASDTWSKFVCEVTWDGNYCVTPGRLTPQAYKQLTALVNASSALYDGIPFVVELMDGTYLTKTLSDLSIVYCSNLHEYSEWVYAGLITSSTALMLSLMQWLIHSEHRRRRAYTKKADAAAAALYSKQVA
ncbi:uncharacterized protein LOC116031369 [Ipomoea triloba]|uniref:uncharacterized protein LOC116031369 n=1 Tax=Ipomoea triloba TaxID=35885 RepID=UPI00125E38FA|nr:uncharacterized protein LOC116031369 [Ipomoea triloba]